MPAISVLHYSFLRNHLSLALWFTTMLKTAIHNSVPLKHILFTGHCLVIILALVCLPTFLSQGKYTCVGCSASLPMSKMILLLPFQETWPPEPVGLPEIPKPLKYAPSSPTTTPQFRSPAVAVRSRGA